MDKKNYTIKTKLHSHNPKVVEKLIDIRDRGTLTMDDYEFVAKLKEEISLFKNENDLWHLQGDPTLRLAACNPPRWWQGCAHHPRCAH